MRVFSSTSTISGFLSNVRDYNLVAVVALVWFLVQFLRYLFPPLFPTFQNVFGISRTQTGLLFTLMMLGYSVAQFPSGWLADRYNEPIVITIGVIVFASATFCIVLTPNYAWLVVAAIFIGIGTGAHKTPAIPYLSRSYPDRTGFSLGIMDTIGQLGGTTAPIVVVAIFGLGYSWRAIFFVSTILSIVVGIIFVTQTLYPHFQKTGSLTEYTKTATSESGIKEADSGVYRSIFSDQRILLFIGVTITFTFTWNGFSAFFPLFLMDEKGFSSDIGGLLYSLVFATSIMQTATGMASDRYQRIDISIVLFITMLICIIGVLMFDTLLIVAIMTAFLGIGLHGFRPVRDSYLVELLPQEVSSGSLGIIRTGMTLVGAISPTVVGYVSDITDFSIAFAVLATSLICGTIFLFILR